MLELLRGFCQFISSDLEIFECVVIILSLQKIMLVMFCTIYKIFIVHECVRVHGHIFGCFAYVCLQL